METHREIITPHSRLLMQVRDDVQVVNRKATKGLAISNHDTPKNNDSVVEDGGVSICLSAWQTQDYIEECLDSIANQTWFKSHDNYEIILGIDACERTLEKVKSIMHKYRNLSVYIMKENVGTYVTCNTIMKKAQYRWLMRFDTDDVMPKDMLEKIFSRDLSNVDVVNYAYNNFGGKNYFGGIAYGSHVVRKSVWEKYGGYRDWRISADYDFLYRIKPDTRCLELCDVVYQRRIHSNSLMRTKGNEMSSKLRTELNNFVTSKSRQNKVIECKVTNCECVYTNRPQLIVSFTTWTKRHDAAAKMLDIFKKQTLKPDKIYCWLSSDEYEGEDVPQVLQNFVDEGYIEVRWVKENTYCHKRHEVFKEHWNDYVFTIDDDIVYPTDYLQKMYDAAQRHPNNPICYTGCRYEYEQHRYNHAIKENPSLKNSFLGGIACFPPRTFPLDDYFGNIDIRSEYAPKCDSSYINVILIKNNVQIFEVNDRRVTWFETIKGTQDVGVWVENRKMEGGGINHMENIVRTLVEKFGIKDKFKSLYPRIR